MDCSGAQALLFPPLRRAYVGVVPLEGALRRTPCVGAVDEQEAKSILEAAVAVPQTMVTAWRESAARQVILLPQYCLRLLGCQQMKGLPCAHHLMLGEYDLLAERARTLYQTVTLVETMPMLLMSSDAVRAQWVETELYLVEYKGVIRSVGLTLAQHREDVRVS